MGNGALFLAVFLACAVEAVEATTIVLLPLSLVLLLPLSLWRATRHR